MTSLINSSFILGIIFSLSMDGAIAPVMAALLLVAFSFYSYQRFKAKVARQKQLSEAREQAFLAMYAALQNKAEKEKKEQTGKMPEQYQVQGLSA